jgi:hypothetical protein
VSCAFIHGGVIHLAFNGYVLWVLGRSLERLLGSARFLALYAVSAVGGSALSLVMLGDRISVGASGALFGLLAFQAGMAWFRSKLLPDALIPIVRQSMLVTLAMNVGVSFLPRVDWAAHLGGGLVGASLILSGVLTIGLTRPGAHDARNERDERVSVPPAPERWSFVLLGTLATALLAAGPLSAAFAERPWELGLPPQFERVRPAGASFSVEIPAGARVRHSREAERGVEVVEFGDERSDPAVGSVTRALGGSAPVNVGVEETIALALARPPRGMTAVSGPATTQLGTRRFVSARYEAGPRLREVAVSLEARGAARVEVECWRALDEACPAGIALRIAGSYQDEPRR